MLIVHVWTRDPKEGPWVLHVDGKHDILVSQVQFRRGLWQTANAGHTPCANWYITGYGEYMITGEIAQLWNDAIPAPSPSPSSDLTSRVDAS